MACRLGDEVDDYCSRCRMLSNNSIESMLGEKIAKVRCRTCNFSHDYRHGAIPEKSKPRKTSQKAAFDAVLSSVMAGKNTAVSGISLASSGSPEEKPPRQRKAVAHHGLFTLSASRKRIKK